MYYKIATLTFHSCLKLPSFEAFSCEPAEPDITMTLTKEAPPKGTDSVSGSIVHREIPDGWFFHSTPDDESEGLLVSRDYRSLRLLETGATEASLEEESYIRVALECFLIHKGFLSLHSSAIELDSQAYAFCGPSGTGKSTRADAWMEAFPSCTLISGDRPLIDVNNLEVYGVPWDGKEQCYRNEHFPLKAICEVRRSASVYIRQINFYQRRLLLLRQSFLPMWDNETAAVQMMNIMTLARKANLIVRLFGGPTEKDAVEALDALQSQYYLKEQPDMKAKSGFILRNIVGEYMLMPTGDTIGKFNGTVLFNEVSAFIWEKMQSPISREDLLIALLDEYEVDEATASKDLDSILKSFRDLDIIEED